MADDRLEERISAILSRMSETQGVDEELAADIAWLADRCRRLDRNLNKISRMSDRMQGQIMDLNDKLRVASITDPLTGLTNRRGAHDALIAQTGVAREQGSSFFVALIDIDHFKGVNDTHGHDVGDEVLIEFSSRLATAMPDQALLARWGGEEFLILLSEMDQVSCVSMIEGFHESLRAKPFTTAVGELRVTASSGVSCYQREEVGYDSTIYRADQALYEAKESGRDRWVMAA
ncbi:MAG: diguanylate cyclase [Alphaproteobacteria bacterium]